MYKRQEYAPFLYVHVLVSCLRTWCTQFVRSRQLNRLVAVDGVLCSATNLGFTILFLSGFHMGAKGYVLAIICSDALSALFVFCIAGLGRYLRPRFHSMTLWKQMLAYSLPMVPAQILSLIHIYRRAGAPFPAPFPGCPGRSPGS